MEKTIKRLNWILVVCMISIGVLGVVNWKLNQRVETTTAELTRLEKFTLESVKATIEYQVEVSKLVSLISDQSDLVNGRQDAQLELIRKWIVAQKPAALRFD
jgi:hypothetical protein